MVWVVSEPTPAFGSDEPAGTVAPVPAFAVGTVVPTPVFPPSRVDAVVPAFAPSSIPPRLVASEPEALFANTPLPSPPVVVPPETPRSVFRDAEAELREGLMRLLDESTKPPEFVAVARTLVVKLAKTRLDDSKAILAFGTDVQAKVAELPGRVLEMLQDAGNDILPRLQSIKAHVVSVSPDDLFASGGMLRNILSSPKERVTHALRQIEIDASAVTAALPAVTQHLEDVDRMMVEEAAARLALNGHIVAGQVVLAYHTKNGVDPKSFGFRTLEDQITSLRNTRLSSSLDEKQLDLLRENFANMVKTARSVTVDMVSAWKRVCITAIGVLDSGRSPRAVGVVSLEMRDMITKIVSTINSAR